MVIECSSFYLFFSCHKERDNKVRERSAFLSWTLVSVVCNFTRGSTRVVVCDDYCTDPSGTRLNGFAVQEILYEVPLPLRGGGTGFYDIAVACKCVSLSQPGGGLRYLTQSQCSDQTAREVLRVTVGNLSQCSCPNQCN